MSSSLRSKLLTVTVFAIAMGLLESAVVIYLREIFYPEGFDFPLKPIPPDLAVAEVLREAATLIMLVAIGILAARTFSEGFAWFIYSFAVWDIFYYLFLYLFLEWPESLLTWDILFLIPATWTGPVITPLILTLLMILFAGIIFIHSDIGLKTRIVSREWIILSAGGLIVIWAFMTDYMKFMLNRFSFFELFGLNDPNIINYAGSYVPVTFPWLLFFIGTLVILSGIILYTRRIRKDMIK